MARLELRFENLVFLVAYVAMSVFKVIKDLIIQILAHFRTKVHLILKDFQRIQFLLIHYRGLIKALACLQFSATIHKLAGFIYVDHSG